VEIRHLRSFVTVAVAGSITRAARQLNLAQPAVSQHVHALEIELGVMLFRRTSRGVTLTEAGMALLGPSRSLLAAEAEARTSVQQIGFETRAEVEIASIPSAAGTLLPRAVRLLHDQSTPFRLRVFEQASDGCLALLAARMVELAIVRDLQPEAGFASEELLHEDLVLAIPSAHPLAMHAKPTLEMFRNENFFMFDFRTGVGLHRMAMEACSAAGFVPRILCEGPEAGIAPPSQSSKSTRRRRVASSSPVCLASLSANARSASLAPCAGSRETWQHRRHSQSRLLAFRYPMNREAILR
jgi:DNA-binding transcriptional LysR family regulator